MEKHDKDVVNVLHDDGVDKVVIGDLENVATTNIDELITKMGSGSWAARLVYNDRFGGVLIQQQPGEGNRIHYHPDADECWVIISGNWEWYIDGEGTKTVSRNDIVVVKQGVKHKITCIGSEPGIRFAITAPDVNHVYSE
ncbi:MAG: cupin domain-containing protein [Candidatus Marinimicrobia bacterium]|jgi:mannose-6-phosphate isomerase-like protein (cupin superfamily)|nr:cupin domain-containing protein [Candidatus Woesearchaeota archaeon]MBT6471079.1 cupin domain-containing protein [Candidatus Neomarinimicrobiota bacterium]